MAGCDKLESVLEAAMSMPCWVRWMQIRWQEAWSGIMTVIRKGHHRLHAPVSQDRVLIDMSLIFIRCRRHIPICKRVLLTAASTALEPGFSRTS